MEYCDKVEQYDYQLYLTINDIDYTKTKVVTTEERYLSAVLQNNITVILLGGIPQKLYSELNRLPSDLDEWLVDYYNNK